MDLSVNGLKFFLLYIYIYIWITKGLGLSSPEELFDFEIFQDDPRPFYKFARQLFPNEKIRPSISHKFVSSLEEKNMLLRIYTQNIDGLEESAGVSTNRVVYAHVSMYHKPMVLFSSWHYFFLYGIHIFC